MTTKKIGLVNLPGLAAVLSGDGFDVVTGEDFKSAAVAVRHAIQAGGPFPVLVGDSADNHVSAPSWLRTVATKAPVVVVRLAGGNGLTAEAVREVRTAPVVVGDVLIELELPYPSDSLFEATLAEDGTVSTSGASPTPAPAEAAVSTPTPAPSPAPAQPAPADQDEDDPWETTVVPGVVAAPGQAPAEPQPQQAAPAAPAQPAAQAGDDDDDWWSDPPPTQAPQQGTAQPEAAPAPAAQPAPAMPQQEAPGEDEEDFDFAAAPAQPAAQPPAPVSAQQQPVTPASPATQPAPSEPEAQAGGGDFQIDDLDDLIASASSARVHQKGVRDGKVIATMASKGGVGKSSLALLLAQYAAVNGPEGYRVVVVDANRGQGDLRTYLRLAKAPIPTIYDAARTGDPNVAISAPSELKRYRDEAFGQLDFALVPAPPADLANPEVVTASVYRDVIEAAKKRADLVVIDTQIAEAHDTSALWEKVMIPLVAQEAWLLGISDTTTPGVRNLAERLRRWANDGVPPDRVLVSVNKVIERDVEQAKLIAPKLASLGRPLGVIPHVAAVETEMRVGRLPFDNPHLAPALTGVLHAVTGLKEFDPADLPPIEQPSILKKLVARFRGEKKQDGTSKAA